MASTTVSSPLVPGRSVPEMLHDLVERLLHPHPCQERQPVHDGGLHTVGNIGRRHDQVVSLGASMQFRHFRLVDLGFDAVGGEMLAHLVGHHGRGGDAGAAGDEDALHRGFLLRSCLTSSGSWAVSRPAIRSGSCTMSMTSARASRCVSPPATASKKTTLASTVPSSAIAPNSTGEEGRATAIPIFSPSRGSAWGRAMLPAAVTRPVGLVRSRAMQRSA